jgi:hypothetical protein
MRKRSILKALALLLLLLLANVSAVKALPTMPFYFHGTVKSNGANVPPGTQISAWINGIQYAVTSYILYNGNTYYGLDVPGDDPTTPVIEGGVTGDTVDFYLGNSKTDQTAILQGTNVSLNLTAPTLYTLSISKTGTGSGMLTSLPIGINCGITCLYAYGYNTGVTLTATPASSSIVVGWSGAGCSGTDTCMVTMDAAKLVTADFLMNSYWIHLPLVIR